MYAHIVLCLIPKKKFLQHEADLGNMSIQPGTIRKKAEIEPGTAYKFRVAGINGCGRGDWSEVFIKTVRLIFF